MTRTFSRAAAMAAMAALAGCAGYTDADEAFPGFGVATEKNARAHIVNPQPETAGDTLIPMDGAKANLALDRYRKGEVIQPAALSTSKIRIGTSGQK